MAKQVTYGYDIDISFVLKKEEIEITKESIQALIVSYDYERMFCPIIYVAINIDISIYHKMLYNKDKGKILLNIQKFSNSDSTKAKKSYIKGHFNYFFPTFDDKSASAEDEDEKNGVTYKSIYMGLLDIDIINDNNSKVINNVFLDSNTMSIAYHYLRSKKIVMEPFDFNKEHNVLIVPPITGINNFLDYLNQMSAFYKTGYRYFRDFKRAYLLSNKGKGIEISGSKQYKSIHINIEGTKNNDNISITGIVKDKKKKCYVIQVGFNSVTVDVDKISDNIYNMYYGVTSEGDVKKKKLNVNPDKKSKIKPKLYRIYNNNKKIIRSAANENSAARFVITLTKSDIDMSLISLHKEYVITFDEESEVKGASGKYILTGKREIFQLNNEEFAGNMIATFKKVPDKDEDEE